MIAGRSVPAGGSARKHDLAAVRVPPGDQLVLPPAASAVIAARGDPAGQGARIGHFRRVGQGSEQQPEPAEAGRQQMNLHHTPPNEQVHAPVKPEPTKATRNSRAGSSSPSDLIMAQGNRP